MDNVTHTLIGVTLANAFWRERYGRAGVVTLALASNLPDIDVLVHVTADPLAVTLRRTFGHSLLLLPIWCLLLALALRRAAPAAGLPALYGLVAAGAGLHLFFDLINSFGVVLLWPLSDARPELAIAFIIDPALLALVAAPLAAAAVPRWRARLAPLSRGALAGVALYLALCAGARAASGALLDRHVSRPPAPPADFAYVFPEPLGPHRWRGVARRGDTWTVHLVRPFTADVRETGRMVSDTASETARRVRASPAGGRIERFFKAPVWETDADRVCVRDLRFTSIVLDRGAVFRFCFRVEDDGGVVPAG